MVKTVDMYNAYVEAKTIEVRNCKEVIKALKDTLNYVIPRLDKYEDFLKRFTNTNLAAIKRMPTIAYLNNIEFKPVEITLSKGRTKNDLLNLARVYIDTTRLLQNEENKINRVKDPISRKAFNYIIGNFNKTIREEIIENGYRFSLGHRIGSFYVVQKKRKRATINWGETKKNKQRLIDEGVEIYDKVNNPNGVKYFVYNVDEFPCWWWWSKKDCNLTNAKVTSFDPAFHTKKMVKQYTRDNPVVKIKYERHGG